MDQGDLVDGLLHAIQDDHSFALDHVVKLGGALMVMLAGSVDVHGVSPRGEPFVLILLAEKQMPPAAGAPFAVGRLFMPDEEGRTHFRAHRILSSMDSFETLPDKSNTTHSGRAVRIAGATGSAPRSERTLTRDLTWPWRPTSLPRPASRGLPWRPWVDCPSTTSSTCRASPSPRRSPGPRARSGAACTRRRTRRAPFPAP